MTLLVVQNLKWKYRFFGALRSRSNHQLQKNSARAHPSEVSEDPSTIRWCYGKTVHRAARKGEPSGRGENNENTLKRRYRSDENGRKIFGKVLLAFNNPQGYDWNRARNGRETKSPTSRGIDAMHANKRRARHHSALLRFVLERIWSDLQICGTKPPKQTIMKVLKWISATLDQTCSLRQLIVA